MAASAMSVVGRPGVKQFIKFCIVGASSFSIDFGVSYILHYQAHLALLAAKTISFCLAVTNGFFWNQRWTFRAVGHRAHHEQYAMFLGVNVVGYVLNAGIVLTIVRLLTGIWNPQETPRPAFIVATLVAMVIVVFWNYFANKHWTFRRPGA